MTHHGCEFDCCECGAHIVRFDTETPPVPPLCAQCLFLPGWHTDPKLRAMLGGGVLPQAGDNDLCGNG